MDGGLTGVWLRFDWGLTGVWLRLDWGLTGACLRLDWGLPGARLRFDLGLTGPVSETNRPLLKPPLPPPPQVPALLQPQRLVTAPSLPYKFELRTATCHVMLPLQTAG